MDLISNDLTITKLQNGSAGANGYNAATIYLYQRSATQPLAPTSTLTYTFATGVLSPSTALGSWKIAPDEIITREDAFYLRETIWKETLE